MNEIGLFPAFAREIFQRAGILDERSSALFFALFSAGSFVLSPCVECLVLKLLGRFGTEAGSGRLRRRFSLAGYTERIRQE